MYSTRLPTLGAILARVAPPVPLVSIVTPVLNGARYLEDCLASVRAQTHPRIEHLVVDGGSTDGTLELLAAAPGVRVLTGRDRGMYDALRRGFQAAEGDVLAYQNADDRYSDAQAVAYALDFLQQHPQVDLVHGDFRWVGPEGDELTQRARRPAPPRDQAAIRHHNFVPPHATFVRARLLRERDLWPDPELQYAGDWDWYVRLHLAGARFAHVPRVLADFRVHSDAKTSTFRLHRKLREWRRICRRHGLSFGRLAWAELFWMPLRYRWAARRATPSP